uniref:Uncharacterized protein n=1 Tax=Anopheles culicifacies TaxID=139723 RepID=A0A182MEM4_9DIPT
MGPTDVTMTLKATKKPRLPKRTKLTMSLDLLRLLEVGFCYLTGIWLFVSTSVPIPLSIPLSPALEKMVNRAKVEMATDYFPLHLPLTEMDPRRESHLRVAIAIGAYVMWSHYTVKGDTVSDTFSYCSATVLLEIEHRGTRNGSSFREEETPSKRTLAKWMPKQNRKAIIINIIGFGRS